MDIETRRQKQQALMVRMVERKVRERAQQLYEERGQEDGQALGDWVRAESEVLQRSSGLKSLYHRLRTERTMAEADEPNSELACQDCL